MASFNILGCCVTRDIFGLHKGNGGHAVFQYVNSFSLMHSLLTPLEIDKNFYNSLDMSQLCSNFDKRCVLLDLSKEVFDYVQYKHSDYLIIDAANVRSDYAQFENGTICRFTDISKKIIDFLISKNIIKEKYDILKFDYMPKREMTKLIDKFCEKVLQLYPLESIILNEVKNAFLVLGKDRNTISKLKNYDLSYRQNTIINFVFDRLKLNLQGCHVINMPNNILCDSCHHLGEAPLHFTEGYYHYALHALNIICKKDPIDLELRQLECLRERWSHQYAITYYARLQRAFLQN